MMQSRRTPRRRLAARLLPLALLLGSCAEGAPLDTLEPRGPEARTIQDLVGPVFLIAGVVFVFVNLGVVFLVVKFRQRKDDDGSLPPQLHGNFKLEIGWTILPALLLAGVGAGSVLTLLDLEDHPDRAMEVTVVGQQWWWEYRYDVDDDGTDDIVTANDLVIPAGQPVSLTITSRDVIHSFWIPALNGKRDAVPGREHPLLIEADRPGVYRGQCTEFCGLSHAYMSMRVVALPEAEYAAWQENQLQGAELPAKGTEAREGKDLFETTCSQCHLIEGDGGNEEFREENDLEGAALVAGAAPDLTHFASRGTFAGAIFDLWEDLDGDGEVEPAEVGEVLNVADLEAWLRDPPGEKPAAAGQSRGMPDLNLTEEQIDALVAYLETLE